MKKFKLFALTALLAMGTNAFAEAIKAKVGDVNYATAATPVGTGAKATPYQVTVASIETADVATLEIPASFSKEGYDGTTVYFNVVGFDSNWDKATGKKDITATLTTLTIDATNMANLANVFNNLTKLATLTVKNGAWTDEGYVTGRMDEGKAISTIENLDLSELTKVETLAGNFKVSGDKWKKLTALKLPKNLKAIPDNCFEESNVTSLTLPATIETIGNTAFKKSAITSIDLSGTKVTVLPAWAFEASKITSVTLPVELTTIGLGAFHSTAITAINIPEKVATIGNQAFEKCEALTSVTGLAGVTSIGEAAFNGAKKLATLDLSAAVKLATIGENAFKGTAITTAAIPNTVTTISASAFEGCEALTTFSVAAAETAGSEALNTLGNNLFKGCKALTSVDLTNSKVTTLDATTFKGAVKLATVKLPNTITSLPAEVFADNVIEELDLSDTGITVLDAVFGKYPTEKKPYASLKSIKLPTGLTKISGYSSDKNGVFSYCTSLEEIELPAGLTTDIDDYTFFFCTSLKKVTYMPVTPKEIRNKAFIGCTPFVKINTNAEYRAKFANVPLNATFGDQTDLKVKTVLDNGTSGMYFGKFCPAIDAQISKADLGDAKLYFVYVDEETAYFQSLMPNKGVFEIKAGDHIIVKSKAATTIEFVPYKGATPLTANANDAIVDANSFTDVTVADYQTILDPASPKYLYLLTNKKPYGFGFTFFGGTNMKAGNFFIATNQAPAAGRLNVVWLDEDGNVESDATAIQSIENAAENDGEIYNLQGVRVNGAQKGIYIKNGKKFIVK